MLSNNVSQWDRRNVEKYLQIFFHGHYLENASDVLEKIPKIGELTEEQNRYCEEVKSYLEKIDTTTYKMKFRPEKFLKAIDEISEKLDQEEEPTESFLKRAVMKFLMELSRVGDDIRSSDEVYEGCFTRLFGVFAEMCCLHSEISVSEVDCAVWKNLKGLKKVTSLPDIRLYRYGVKTTKSLTAGSKMAVSVVKVIKDAVKQFGDSDTFDPLSERLDSTHLSGSSNSSLESTDDSTRRPPIEAYLSSKEALGQHAGELLLDLYKFRKDKTKEPKLTMPGMIVDGTLVFFTVLEMQRDHLKKLENNQDLDEYDRAVIYYSKPFDLLYSDERNILIDNFMRLNNIEL